MHIFSKELLMDSKPVFRLSDELSIKGSPTITSDGFISNFSYDNFLRSVHNAEDLMSGIDYEINLKFKFYNITTENGIFWTATTVSGSSYDIIGVGITCESSRLYVYINTGSSTNLRSVYSPELTTDTWYTLNYKCYNYTHTFTGVINNSFSTGNEPTCWNIHIPLKIGYGQRSSDALVMPMYGVIDLKETWIKSNGQYVIYNLSK